MASKSVRSKGTSVAVLPAARTASSASSSPPTVRATSTSWAPSTAKRRATAAPRPREAPVMRARRPASRPGVGDMRLGRLGKQRELGRGAAAALVGEGGWVIAGEAGVAELRALLVAAGFAHGAVEAVDGDEGQAVDVD